MNQLQYSVVPFDHQWLKENPEKLEELARFYCSIWEMDENFGEYRKCPKSGRYYSYEQVEIDRLTNCEDCGLPLVLAWEPEEVAQTILEDSSKPDFVGFIAYSEDQIIGFAWAKILDFTDITQNWGEAISSKLQTQTEHQKVAYFNELAVAPNFRGLGIGKNLVRLICEWMRLEHPGKMTLLRTHEKSKARGIYEKVGYQVFDIDTEHGYGRIMMMFNPCASLPTDKLI